MASNNEVSRPAWWPTKEQKKRADNAHADAEKATWAFESADRIMRVDTGEYGQVMTRHAVTESGDPVYEVLIEGETRNTLVRQSNLRATNSLTDEESKKRFDLERLADGAIPLDEWSNDELLALGIGYGVPGPLSDDQVMREATERLAELQS